MCEVTDAMRALELYTQIFEAHALRVLSETATRHAQQMIVDGISGDIKAYPFQGGWYVECLKQIARLRYYRMMNGKKCRTFEYRL